MGSSLSSKYTPLGLSYAEILIIERIQRFRSACDGLGTTSQYTFNESFVPIEMSGIDAASSVIYNRWGAEVFSLDLSVSNGWDGRDRGSLAAPAVYFWRVQFTTIDGQMHELKGTVTLRL